MMTKEDKAWIAALLDEKLAPIHARLDGVDRTNQALVTAVTDLLEAMQSPLAFQIKRNLERELA